jgi:type III restriction enzyme
VTYGRGKIFPEYFSNTETRKHTIRIDSKLLEQAESEQPGESRQAEAERLRRVVATVGKLREPGEQVRCVVSVGMLTEGWDANNVTNILGLRAFGSQLLAEQVVGRGLRRIDYTPDPETGLLTEEYVDVYGIPFSVIPFKGRTTNAAQPEDRPKQHVRALPERAQYEIRFPLVEGYAFALKKNSIRANVSKIEGLALEPDMEPTAVFVKPTVGYQTGTASGQGPGEFDEQDREAFYRTTHLQQIEFEIARQIVTVLVGDSSSYHGSGASPALRRQGRQQLFPQVLRLVKQYLAERVDFRGVDPRELGHERYVKRIVDRLVAAIEPDDAEGEPPLMPILNRYTPTGSTANVDFKTTKPCYPTNRSHINQIPADTKTWEQSAAFRLEQAKDVVAFYARNEGLDFVIPYEYLGVEHNYEPDYLVRMTDGTTLILEIKGYLADEDRQKHEVAKRWVKAVNNWGGCGIWAFYVCRDPQQLARELRNLFPPPAQAAD